VARAWGNCRAWKKYAEYHTKGLEVLGVSNDLEVSNVKNFLAKNDMPWPELYDPTAAEKQELNPLTRNLGITGIPRMFLIDKKGVCRTVSADDSLETLIPKMLAEPG
jgi:peroxiredoxin